MLEIQQELDRDLKYAHGNEVDHPNDAPMNVNCYNNALSTTG
jgi:hypothetical protein